MKWLGQYIQDLPSTFRDDVIIDRDTSGDAAENATGLHLDFDRTVPGSGTAVHRDVGIDLEVNSASLGTSSLYGMDIDVRGTTSGTSTAYGIDLEVGSADTNIGMQITTVGTHLKLVHNANDYATFTVADTGDLTIATIGDGTTDSDLTLDVDGDIALDAAGQNIVATSDQFNFNSANANDPLVIIKNTANDATSGRLRFLNERGADGQDDDETGIIQFFSYDDGTPSGEEYATIKGTIHDATSGQESGKLQLQVASHDGGSEDGLVLTGGSADAEVDVTVGNGADSVVTIPGQILAVNGGTGTRHYGTKIKILPSDFMSNDDGGSTKFGIGFVEASGTWGMKIPNADTELLAFVSIPEGMKATHVDIFDDGDNRAIEVFEANVNSSTIATKGTGNCNTTLDITDVNATATNYLAILVTTTATSDRTYGGTVTIAAQ